MRALVTGGAGFVGTALVERLVRAGDVVVVIDNLVNGRAESVDPGARLVRADVRDGAAVAAAMRGIEVVYHLACLGVRHSLVHPAENLDVNTRGTLVVLEAARAAGVARFVHVSSSGVYGTARAVPMAETHPTEPETVYGAGKLGGEALARAAWRTWGFPTVVVRPFNAYGPRSHHEGDAGEVIPRFLLRARAGLPLVIFGDGAQTRDFTFVEDTAAGIHAAATADAVGGTFNLATGVGIPIGSLAEAVGRALGVPVRVRHDAPRPGDVRALVGEAASARAVLGWSPVVPLDEGLRRTAAWFATQGDPAVLLAAERLRSWESRG